MTTLEEAQAQVQAQRQMLEQRRKEAIEQQQKLAEAKSKLPDATSQMALRQKFKGLQGRNIRQRIAGVLSGYETQNKDIEAYKQELSQYDTQTLRPAEEQIKQLQGQYAEYQAEQDAYNLARKAYYSENPVLKAAAESGQEGSRVKYYYEQFTSERDAYQEVQDKIDAVNSGVVSFDQAFPQEYLDKLDRSGIKINQEQQYAPVKIQLPAQDLPREEKVKFSDAFKAGFGRNSVIPLVSAALFDKNNQNVQAVYQPTKTFLIGTGKFVTSNLLGTPLGKRYSIPEGVTKGVSSAEFSNVFKIGSEFAQKGYEKITTPPPSYIKRAEDAAIKEFQKKGKIVDTNSQEFQNVVQRNLNLMSIAENPLAFIDSFPTAPKTIPIRNVKEPSFIEVQRPLIVNGKETTASQYTIFNEKSPPRLWANKDEGFLGGTIRKPIIEKIKSPTIIGNEPFVTFSRIGKGTTGEYNFLSGESIIRSPTNTAELNSLPKREQLLWQRVAEARTGRPVALKNVPKVLPKDAVYSKGYLEQFSVGRYKYSQNKIKTPKALSSSKLSFNGKSLWNIKTENQGEFNLVRTFTRRKIDELFPITKKQKLYLAEAYGAEKANLIKGDVTILEPQVAKAVRLMNKKGYETVSSGFTPSTTEQHIVFNGKITDDLKALGKNSGVNIKQINDGQIEASINQKGKSLKDIDIGFTNFAKGLKQKSKSQIKATLFEKAFQGKATSRFETASQFSKVKDTDQFEVFKGKTLFKDVTKPFARTTGKTPRLKGTVYRIKQPIILGEDTGIKVYRFPSSKKTPFSSTFGEKAQDLTQEIKLIPKPIPKTPKTQTAKLINTKPTSISYGTIGVLSGSISGINSGLSDQSNSFSFTDFIRGFEDISFVKTKTSAETFTGSTLGGLSTTTTQQSNQTDKLIVKETSLLKQDQKPSSLFKERQVSIPKLTSRTIQKSAIPSASKLRLFLRTTQKQISKATESTTKAKPPRNPRFFKRSSKKQTNPIGELISGDQIEVFGRRYGRDFSLGKFTSQPQAEREFIKFAKGTLGASGKFFKAGKPIKVNLGGEFRPSKADRFRIVQKAKFRLSTRPEVKEIQFFKKRRGRL